MKNAVLILDFGGQYKQLIAKRVRALHVFAEIRPYSMSLDAIREGAYGAIILTGGPSSVNEKNALLPDPGLFDLGIPVLGICYGAQAMAHTLGGQVERGAAGEYGNVDFTMDSSNPLFQGLPKDSTGWMSHFDIITKAPEGFTVSAQTANTPIAAMENVDRKIYAVQFHPEVEHTPLGMDMFRHFLFDIAHLSPDWKMDAFAQKQIEAIREKVGDSKVLCALSGGVDSSVAAVLVHKAIGKNLTCIFVDHGLLRKKEGDEVERVFREQFDMNLIRVNAEDRFLSKLAGVTDTEQKRKIIGEEFIRVFEEQSHLFKDCDWLVQGTIYPDVIESGVGGAVIKSHHNVGGLPDDVSFKGIVEPLRDLFKDEVRQVGLELGIPERLVWRQPFPGPGLAIRCIGAVTKDRLEILRDADAIFREEVQKASLYRQVSQFFAVITNMRSVGVQGDERTYDYTIALRAVTTTDFMTADWARLPYDLLATVSRRIVNEVKNVNRVVYDITSKPPATIEWE